MPFVDFADVKDAVSFADAISYLNLKFKAAGSQWRGACPTCQTGGDRALVLTEGRGWYCHAQKAGGDVIALAAHILGVKPKEAALELAQRAGIVPVDNVPYKKNVTVPESEGVGGSKLQPLSYLEHEHDLVTALGLDPQWCKENGVGYAPRGVVRGSIAIPFRDDQGVLLGYFGVQDLTYLPPDFQTNVVKFAKRA